MRLKGTLGIFMVLVTIGINFNQVSGSCCHKVRAWWNVKNNAYGQRSGQFGYYTMQTGTVNGKAHYLADDGKDAIWFYDSKNQWIVGSKSWLGSTNGSLYVNSNAACPYTPSWTWKYYDQYGNWRDADKGFTIYCKT